MKRTSPWTLLLLGVSGIVVGWLFELFLVSIGRATLVPPYALAISLVLLGVAVVAVAVPVRRVARGRPGARVDPFYATRVLALAKATGIAAAVFVGLMGGAVIFVASRPVVATDLLWQSVAGFAASAALLVAAIVAENMCRIPPRDEDDHEAREIE